MISTFKKYWSRLKNKVCPALLSICLISCVASPFASAAVWEGSINVGSKQYYQGSWDNSLTEIVQDVAVPISNYYVRAEDTRGPMNLYINTRNENIFSGNVDAYVSYYVRVRTSSASYPMVKYGDPFNPENYIASYYDHNETLKYVDIASLDEFAPQESNNHGRGVSMKVSFRGSEATPIKNFSIYPIAPDCGWMQPYDFNDVVYTSVRFITSESSAELDSLSNIADEIAEQSDILQGMKGEIVAILQDIYLRLGDMEKAQDLLNEYMATLIPLIRNIDTSTTNIYSLLSTQFELLRASINTASNDIQSAISAQTSALIAYFDSVFSGAVGTLPEKSDDLDSTIGSVDQSESEYKSDASAKFEQLSTQFNGFTGGTLSGIALASNLFTQTWNALGEYSVVYSFPLLFGLCLLLIGRLSKHSGGQSSTDKERGDSDA